MSNAGLSQVVRAPSGLSPEAPGLPAKDGTGRRGTASGAAMSSAVHEVTSVGVLP